MSATKPLVALLSDFGTSDPYVGVMKGVMISRCPDIQLIDITHEVYPQNIAQGAYLLHSAYQYFPRHTVFLCVVDPGVGTDRLPIAVQADQGIFVGPNNGLFSTVLDECTNWQAVILQRGAGLSDTFHGRDLFAPTAADLACGKPVTELGIPCLDLIRITTPDEAPDHDETLNGRVIHIDHFGNIIMDIGPFQLEHEQPNVLTLRRRNKLPLAFSARDAKVLYKNKEIVGLFRTYGDTSPGDILALINSNNHLEIAINQGHAARWFAAQLGDPVQLKLNPLEK